MPEVKSLTYTFVQTAEKSMDQTCQGAGGSQQPGRPVYAIHWTTLS